ncbi:MAG: hypothetical protein ACN6O1_06130 [Comamonas sp.]|uniref:hypothetical protein n=1 Tax=Comamonas sp. TaxID=34028 RepID=UPI003D12D70A
MWKLTSGRGSSATVNTIKTQGNLSTNDGETALAPTTTLIPTATLDGTLLA